MPASATIQKKKSGKLFNLPDEITSLCLKPRRSGFYNDSKPVLAKGSQVVKINKRAYLRIKSRIDNNNYDSDELDSPHIINLNADICHFDAQRRIGHFSGYIIPAYSQAWDNNTLFVECDSRNSHLCEFAENVMLSGIAIEDFCQSGDVLFAHELEVLSKWRGLNIGIIALQTIIEYTVKKFGVAICCFKPFPLQFQSSLDEGPLQKERNEAFEYARKKLIDYYLTKIPAKPIPKSETFFFVEANNLN